MTTRRDFLAGRPFRSLDQDELPVEASPIPVTLAADTVRLATTAMASDFEVILNPGPAARLEGASSALELVSRLEDQLSVYRPQSELSRLNRQADREPVEVEPRMLGLIQEGLALACETGGAFDPTAGPLVALWRMCRGARRLPTAEELDAARSRVGYSAVRLDPLRRTVSFERPGMELNFNAMGKGYALDRAGEHLEEWFSRPAEDGAGRGVEVEPRSSGSSWLMHGGYSSLLARGSIAGADGWPIALRDPVVAGRALGTVWLKDRGLSTSGAGVQFFRFQGKRYGHLIDPRTGWPAEGVLMATVLAPTAARAEALSTAFFVLGVETARTYCHNHPEVAALLVPAPEAGKRSELVHWGLSESELMLAPSP